LIRAVEERWLRARKSQDVDLVKEGKLVTGYEARGGNE